MTLHKSSAATVPTSAHVPFGRAYLGLALLGWGLSILLGITPHEDRIVGSALTLFGLALLTTAPRFPEFRALPAWAIGGLGAIIVAILVGYTTATHTGLDAQKIALIVVGLALMAAAPALNKSLRMAMFRRTVSVASLVVMLLAVLAAPLAIWAFQAAASLAFATTPTDLFVQYGLVMPSGFFLSALGLQPTLAGQTIAYATPNGPLLVEVGAACSGIQAMALFMAVLAAYLWSEKPGGRHLAVWSAIGFGGVYLTNLIRLEVLFLVGYHWGSDALLRVHAQAGWMFFVAWALAFAALTRCARIQA